jgi:2-keto-4-pentenoate hydratase/2-oxohepta-3-ene-1,7-dioic acid hydratase in catechol pathway
VAHIEEGGGKLQPEHTQAPWLFCVPPTSVMIGHGEKIQLLPQAQKIDYEGELAVVIGRKAKSVAAKDAADYIVGYTIYNDVSERTPFMIEHVEEKQQLSFWYTKSFDTFGPNGPFITTSDEIADPQDLTIRVNVNGEERQNCSTNQMIFSVYELVEFLTSFLTLEPGDVIATGTPAGVGSATGFFLKGGDTVQISIDGLGTLGNSVVQT